MAVRAEAHRAYPLETGGLLLGWWDEDGRTAWVETVVGPGPEAHHARASFEPDWHWQQDQVARLYTRYARRLQYLGDWHTHPNGRPVPSRADRSAALEIADAPTARAPHPLMLIVGCAPSGALQPQVYVLQGRELHACRLDARF